MSHLIATFFYVGHLRPAPGTWGSLAALPAAWLIATLTGFAGLLLATILVFAIGYWATKTETHGKANHDPSEIVIDEVAGQWVALLPVVYGAAMMQADLLALYPGWIGAFALFRLFDITKPSLVGWADRRDDALGVMLDDIIAGVFAAIGVVALAAVAHGLMRVI
ncbi:phosphatidylglycerophosphatase A family protein [Yoonia sp. 208BN28-4]|uniref:phosphatidylglycerophosphatase A family protein n=1 Tax=Yoonia sp. 208BN28-4 TaxID=3126505 RepID=UPI0030A97FAA